MRSEYNYMKNNKTNEMNMVWRLYKDSMKTVVWINTKEKLNIKSSYIIILGILRESFLDKIR